MRKVFQLEDLDCANCAAKMEAAIQKIEGVTFASVSYMTQKMTLEAADDVFDDCFLKVQKVCKKVEPDCKITK